ncbi:MAG TPA: hypothetical protein VJO72_13130, partial [Candidatus Dormibacteraeota bacterium]|nr:hypothetical protein [Candidatus Dormibacteraeota bacterium]
MAVGSGSPEAYTQAAKPGITWIDGSAGNVIAARGVAVGVGVGGRAVAVAWGCDDAQATSTAAMMTADIPCLITAAGCRAR